MFGFLRSTPSNRHILSDDEVNQSYRYWRLHIMIGMYVGYAGFYFTRKTFNYAAPAMITDLGLDKGDIGLIGTLFYLSYGLSKFISGTISDRSNPRYFMGLGLVATGLINIAFGFSSSLAAFIALWVLNAWFQGWGWPSCSKLLTTWYSRSERGFRWAIWNTAHNVGGALIPILVGYLTLQYSWRSGFIWPGVIGVFIGLIVCWRLRDKPTTMGLPTVGKWRNDHLELAQENHGQGLSYREILKTYVFSNKYIWLLAFSYVLVYIVRTAVNDWGNLYLTEEHHYSLINANAALSLFEIGGFVGSLVAGWGSDRLFGGNRGPMNILFAIGIFLSVSALWLMPLTNFVFQAAGLFCVGFFVFGPQMLIGMAAALSGYPLALVLETYGWSGFFITISTCAAVIGLLLLPFLQAQSPQKSAEARSGF